MWSDWVDSSVCKFSEQKQMCTGAIGGLKPLQLSGDKHQIQIRLLSTNVNQKRLAHYQITKMFIY